MDKVTLGVDIGGSHISCIGFAMPGPFDYANGIGRFSAELRKFGIRS